MDRFEKLSRKAYGFEVVTHIMAQPPVDGLANQKMAGIAEL